MKGYILSLNGHLLGWNRRVPFEIDADPAWSGREFTSGACIGTWCWHTSREGDALILILILILILTHVSCGRCPESHFIYWDCNALEWDYYRLARSMYTCTSSCLAFATLKHQVPATLMTNSEIWHGTDTWHCTCNYSTPISMTFDLNLQHFPLCAHLDIADDGHVLQVLHM